MNAIKNSELVLAQDGSLYHIHLKNEQIADTVILVGDPQRVTLFKPIFDSLEYETQNREIHSITGVYKGTRLTVISTGMGTDNIDIVVNELDAAVNIDLEHRIPKETHRQLNVIRIGTSGALHAAIPVGSFVASEYAIGFDGLLNFYKHTDTCFEPEMTKAFLEHAKWDPCFATPYIVKCDEKLLQAIAFDCYKGITATASGFYAPQGRVLRLETAIPDINALLSSFSYRLNRVNNFEMETSAIYGLSKLLGHRALTVCLIIANRETGDFLSDYKLPMQDLINQILDRVVEMSK